jgi:hypothetical protein
VSIICKGAGISQSTWSTWRRRAEQGEQPFLGLLQAVTRAEAQAAQDVLRRVIRASKGDWRAGAFFLERRHKDEFGRHETVDQTITVQRAEEGIRRLLKGRELMLQYYEENQRLARKALKP